MVISDQEFTDYGGGLKAPKPSASIPTPYNKTTRTSFGRATAWTRQEGMGISKQSPGSFLSFDEDTPSTTPQSDKGASFGRGQ